MSDNQPKKPVLNHVVINSVRVMVNKEGMLVLDRYIKMDNKQAFDDLWKMTAEDVKALL
jgi:hypothetical protein